MRKPGLEEAQAGIKIAWKNINNLRYEDDTTLYCRKYKRTKEPFFFLSLSFSLFFSFSFFSIYFFSWRLITLQYCSGFCHTLT